MKLLKLAILFFVSFSHSQHVFTQSIRVVDLNDNEGVEFVVVYNIEQSIIKYTDYNGKVDISEFNKFDSIYFQHAAYFLKSIYKPDIDVETLQIELKNKNILLNEFVVSASKYKESKNDIVNMIDVIDHQNILESNHQTSADLLVNTGNILVQKSQGGGGSPIIRGFEANKILLVVDGVRMNNAIYRNGHLQNAITIDNSILERTEIVFGPGALMYGSDALGGVIHYYTKEPKFSTINKPVLNTYAYTQYSSANNAKIYHADINLGFSKLAQVASITFSKFDDIKMGQNNVNYPENFGKTYHYAGFINGKDSMMTNDDPYLQRKTGYEQLDLLYKLKFSIKDNIDILLNTQYSTSGNISRYDNLSEYNDGYLKFAEWHYGPQKRFFSSLEMINKKKAVFYDYYRAIASYQKIDEDRISRKFNKTNQIHQEEDVNVYGLNLDFFKIIALKHRLNYGFDAYANQLESEGYEINIMDQSRQWAQSRYPEGLNKTFSASAFWIYKWFIRENIMLTGGSRYSYSNLYSDFPTNDYYQLPFNEVTIKNGAITGSLGVVYHPISTLQVNMNISSGYRNPNIDDYGKIRAKDEQITIPSSTLQPEYSYNGELGITKTISEIVKINITGYYTYLDNVIVRQNGSLMNSDSLLYDGDMYRIVVNENSSNAYISGVSGGLYIKTPTGFKVKSTINYTKGKNKANNEPLGHIPPLFGLTTLDYHHKLFFIGIWSQYNGFKALEEMSYYGEDNDSEGAPDGFKSWYTLNFKSGIKIKDYIMFKFSIENILDRYYKSFASGVSAPGRNYVVSMSINI